MSHGRFTSSDVESILYLSFFFFQKQYKIQTLAPNLKQYPKVSSKFLYIWRKSFTILPEHLDFKNYVKPTSRSVHTVLAFSFKEYFRGLAQRSASFCSVQRMHRSPLGTLSFFSVVPSGWTFMVFWVSVCSYKQCCGEYH